jgi:ubiquinone/menaquinone biosynthesis C-methylase UbiE
LAFSFAWTSHEDRLEEVVGHIIAKEGTGLHLDVGCGARTCPPFMAHSGEKAEWSGIDPRLSDARRQFPFAQARAGYLPFRPETFDGALYASTLYHVLDPVPAESTHPRTDQLVSHNDPCG